MKKILSVLVLVLFFSVNIYSYPNGIALRTLKTTTAGCGSCHIFGTSTSGSFIGPDTVNAGQTVQFTVQFLGTVSGKYGVDIAARSGTLSPGSSSAYLKILSDELVQKAGMTVTTLTFDYTAPLSSGIDSLFATVAKGEPGAWNWVPGKRIVVKLPTGIEKQNGMAFGYSLKQNYPNPFNPVTKIIFSVPQNEFVNIIVYDIRGREVAKIINSALPSGNYSVDWYADGITSGVYYYRMMAGSYMETKTMILLR